MIRIKFTQDKDYRIELSTVSPPSSESSTKNGGFIPQVYMRLQQ